MCLNKILGRDPKRDHRKRLIAPREITPQHIEIDLRHDSAEHEHGHRKDNAVAYALLIKLGGLREYKSR